MRVYFLIYYIIIYGVHMTVTGQLAAVSPVFLPYRFQASPLVARLGDYHLSTGQLWSCKCLFQGSHATQLTRVDLYFVVSLFCRILLFQMNVILWRNDCKHGASSEIGMYFRAHNVRERIDNLYTMWELVLVYYSEAGFFSSDYNVVCRKRFSLLFFQM